MVELAQIPNGAHVLDVATGRGAVLFPAAESVGTHGLVIGIDLSEKMAQETAKEVERLGLSPIAEVRQMDAEDLQFPDKTFDFVLCCFAIFFFPQLDRAMSEFRRVLKPNGHIVVSTWDKLLDEEMNWFNEIVKTYLPSEPEESKPATPDSYPVFDTVEGLRTIMEAAGFADVRIMSEAAEFVYATEEEFWSTLWSHGARVTLEAIEEKRGAEGLQRFKMDVYAKSQSIKQIDGIHQSFPVLFALATRQGESK
ncbi:MAG: Ubiquinone/menaquinone biosynthesis C-methyltransferase UbiE [Anaerolineales bacterium]|nr:Ubiquinone/menaquinone biosynthesis C-methyltransferase UbiE [Anaerolineales bacterium]